MKYCKNCGFPAESDEQQYCSQCGMPFYDAASKSNENGMIDHRAKENDSKGEPIEPPKPPLHNLIDFVNSKIGKGVIFGVVAVLLFLIGFLLASQNPDPPLPPMPTPAPTPTHTLDTVAPTSEPANVSPTVAPDSVSLSLNGLVVPGEHTATASDSVVVLRNALPNGIITVDGVSVPFNYVGPDVTISRSLVPDYCIIRIIAPYENNYATAAVCYNCNYGNDMILGSTEEDGINNYGAYTSCDISGYAVPNSSKFIDIVTWDYFEFYQEAINSSDATLLKYVANNYIGQRTADAMSEFGVQYNLRDFSATTDPESIHILNNPDGMAYVVVNARFKGNVTNNSGMEYANERFYTLRYVWEDNMWQVGDSALISADDFNNGIVDTTMGG